MRNIRSISDRQHPLVSAFLFLITVLVGFVVIGPLVGTFVNAAFYEGNIMEFMEKLQDPFDDPSLKPYYYSLQGFATGLGLIVIPFLYMKVFTGKSLGYLSPVKNVMITPLIVTLLIVVAFMVVNSIFIEWNSKMELPDSMSGIEEWMRQTEKQAARLTDYMTFFDSQGQFLVAILVIAILPAIGEEFVFRGFIQTELTAGTGNPHVAIWLSAAIFSAIHLQFFGFIPRMLLGALFGYLYYWSGNLTYPIIAHFMNNASQLFLIYFVQHEVIDINMDDPESFPVTVIILFAIITFGLLIFFKRLQKVEDQI